jgi:hypothetical protein
MSTYRFTFFDEAGVVGFVELIKCADDRRATAEATSLLHRHIYDSIEVSLDGRQVHRVKKSHVSTIARTRGKRRAGG